MHTYKNDTRRKKDGDTILNNRQGFEALGPLVLSSWQIFSATHLALAVAVDHRTATEIRLDEARSTRDVRAEALYQLYAWAWNHVLWFAFGEWSASPPLDARVRDRLFPGGAPSVANRTVSSLQSSVKGLLAAVCEGKAKELPPSALPAEAIDAIRVALVALDAEMARVDVARRLDGEAYESVKEARAEWDLAHRMLVDNVRFGLASKGRESQLFRLIPQAPTRSGSVEENPAEEAVDSGSPELEEVRVIEVEPGERVVLDIDEAA